MCILSTCRWGGKLHPLGLKEQRHAGRLWLSTVARGGFGQSRVAVLVSEEGNLSLGQQVTGGICESSWGQASLWEQSEVWLLVLENELNAGEARQEDSQPDPAARSEQRVSLCTAVLRDRSVLHSPLLQKRSGSCRTILLRLSAH